MLTIKHAARLVGLPESTLRAWERRYGIGASLRSEAGYRLYDDADLRVLRQTKDLVDAGWSPNAAAAEATRRAQRAEQEAAGRAAEQDAVADQAPPVPDDDPHAEVDALVPLAQSFDVRALAEMLDARFSAASFETVVDTWLMPALARLGQAWDDGRVSVSGEHFVSHGVVRRLSSAFEAAGARTGGGQVVVGLPPGTRHDLGMLAFATAARRAGLAVRYLGTDVPVDDWVTAVESTDVRCAVLSAPLEEDVPRLDEVVAELHRARPDLLVAVGGAHQHRAPEGCLRLGHSIGEAAAQLAERLHR